MIWCFLTIRCYHTGPLGPGTPALTHKIIEARHPPFQSSHYFYCAFTHRHHHCAASNLRHISRSRQDGKFLRARSRNTHVHSWHNLSPTCSNLQVWWYCYYHTSMGVSQWTWLQVYLPIHYKTIASKPLIMDTMEQFVRVPYLYQGDTLCPLT